MNEPLVPNQPSQQEPQQLSRKQLRRQARLERKAQEHTSQAVKKTTKRIILWTSIIAVIALVVWGFTKLSGDNSPVEVGANAMTLTANDHIKGNASSTVTLIEYSDFQCPACGAYFPLVEQMATEFGGSARFIYRHFPLLQVHPNALAAAHASEAASIQGKFWEMYQTLFKNQIQWSSLVDPTDTFVGYARTIGINADQFKKDLTSGAVKSRVEQDMDSGNALGVNSTPTFYLNGKRIQPRSVDEFRNFFVAAGASLAK